MSYCRFSDDDCQCDVYCYAYVDGGYMTHVAMYMRVFDGPLPPPVEFDRANMDAWMARNRIVTEMVRRAERKRIGLPYDGQSFSDDTAGEAADRLEMLRDVGYRVPQYAIDALRAEGE